jgi:chorismate dehydratase
MHLIPDLGIVSKGSVGSVMLFGSRPIESMRDIALPSDSSTSQSLLKWLLQGINLDPKMVEMGPDIETMLSDCDGALLIGDRALSAASRNPDLVKLDLGAEWTNLTGLPMVFGVFAARRDSPIELVREAHDDMVEQYYLFERDSKVRAAVIGAASESLGFTRDRMESYFERGVSNVLDNNSISGLLHFLREVCGMEEEPTWFNFD